MTSLSSISAAATPGTFPLDALDGCESALLLFGAGFLGRNDAIHVWNAGIESATVVDVDAGKLNEMAALYVHDGWQFVARDAYQFAQAWQEQGRAADVVIVDPWTQHVGRALDQLPLWCSVARKTLIIGASAEWFAEKGADVDAGGVRWWLRARFPEWRELPIVWRLVKRSNHKGGVWWIVFDPRSAT